MKFSMIFEIQLTDPSLERERAYIHESLEQAVFAEQMGFDAIWSVEHHGLYKASHMSAPEVFLSAVAARTSRIRIGHGAVCMPFNYNQPIRVAERAAMLDVISNGRVNLGAARGAGPQEMSLCNVDPELTEAHVHETLKVIGNAWRDPDFHFSWDSELLKVSSPEGRPPHTIVPRPVQLPHPPLFLACTSEATIARAARYGTGALVLGYAGPEAVGKLRAIYDAALETRDPADFVSPGTSNDYVAALCPTLVLSDGEEAMRQGAAGQRFFAESNIHWAAPPGTMELPAGDFLDIPAEENYAYMDARAADTSNPVSSIYNRFHAYGTPDVAIDYVERLERAGIDEVLCLMQMGGISHELIMETLRHWGETVIPRFRDGVDADAAVATGAGER